MKTKDANYGIHLNIPPAIKGKRVVIHRLPCKSYKIHKSERPSAGIYSADKNCKTFEEAIERSSKWALEWHAPIKICKKCRPNWEISE